MPELIALHDILVRYEPKRESLIPVLQDVQAEYHYLPEEYLKEIAIKLTVPLNEVFSVATFYNAFSLKPKGENIIQVCMGTACHVRGAPRVLEGLERFLGIKSGETTDDKKFSLETVNCLGACALGPIIVVNQEYYGNMTPSKISTIIDKYAKRKSL